MDVWQSEVLNADGWKKRLIGAQAFVLPKTLDKRACKYYISALGVGLKEMLILLMWLGGLESRGIMLILLM